MARTSVADHVKDAAELLKQRPEGKAAPAFATVRPRPTMVRLETIEVDSLQPRKDIGDISDLVASIRQHGLIQPLVLEALDSKRFRLIAGQRRFRASQEAGLDVVPAIVRTVEDQQRLEIQLIENLHRKDLNPFEEAEGYKRLLDEFNLTHAQVAEAMGKSRTHITQSLSLTKIPEDIRTQCQSSDIALSRDVLYLIAKQRTAARMLEVLQDARSGRTFEERRERARKGKARTDKAKKPKAVYETRHGATVIVQSLSDTLTPSQTENALKEALRKATT